MPTQISRRKFTVSGEVPAHTMEIERAGVTFYIRGREGNAFCRLHITRTGVRLARRDIELRNGVFKSWEELLELFYR